MKSVAFVVLVSMLATPAEAEECRQPLRWYDKATLALTGVSGFRDAVSTLHAIETINDVREQLLREAAARGDRTAAVPTAGEANPVYRVLHADPIANPQGFAWLIGGSTAGSVLSSAQLMTSCDARKRWVGRIAAYAIGGLHFGLARRNDAIAAEWGKSR